MYGVPTEYYGYLFSLNIIGVMLMSAVNRRIVSAMRLDKLLRYATMRLHMCNDCYDFNVYGQTLFMAYCNRQFLILLYERYHCSGYQCIGIRTAKMAGS